MAGETKDVYEALKGDALWRQWVEDAAQLWRRAQQARTACVRLEELQEAMKDRTSRRGLSREGMSMLCEAVQEHLALYCSFFVGEDAGSYSLLLLLRSMSKNSDLLTFERWNAAGTGSQAEYDTLWSGPGAQQRRADLQKTITSLPTGKHKAGELREAIAIRFSRTPRRRMEFRDVQRAMESVYQAASLTRRWLQHESKGEEAPAVPLFVDAESRNFLRSLFSRRMKT